MKRTPCSAASCPTSRNVTNAEDMLLTSCCLRHPCLGIGLTSPSRRLALFALHTPPAASFSSVSRHLHCLQPRASLRALLALVCPPSIRSGVPPTSLALRTANASARPRYPFSPAVHPLHIYRISVAASHFARNEKRGHVQVADLPRKAQRAAPRPVAPLPLHHTRPICMSSTFRSACSSSRGSLADEPLLI